MSCFLTSQRIEFSEPRPEVFVPAIKLPSVPSVMLRAQGLPLLNWSLVLQVVHALACPMLVKLATAKLTMTRRLHAALDPSFQVSV